MKLDGEHLLRYRQIAKLLWKYGRSDLVDQIGADVTFDDELEKPPHDDTLPGQLVDDLEAMGPTYVKLGQLLSSRPDVLPDAYTRALVRLQDKVKPFPYEQVEQIVSEELGVRISKAFARFDREPLASASLGQVHAAAMRDGREVVVKVQRPGIWRQIATDLEVLEQIAGFLVTHSETGRKYRLLDILAEFRVTVRNELDYEREAQNLVALGRSLEEFDRIVVPQPVQGFTTRRILTMDFVRGRKITKVSPLARLEIDGALLADQLFRAYLRQVLVDGLFHADPHPGNIFVTDDGRLALLDLGMVGRVSPSMQQDLIKILIAIGEGKSDDVVKVILDISETAEGFDAAAFGRQVGQILADTRGRGIQQISTGRALLEATRTGMELGLYVPSELSLLGKTLLQLDEVAKILDPGFDPNAAIRRNVAEVIGRRVNREAVWAQTLKTLIEAKDFITGLPDRLNRILDVIGKGELEMNVRASDAEAFLGGLEKIANRITSGIIVSALIVGASLLMQVGTDFRILGYPGLAILCFLAAAAGGVLLLASIFVQDSRRSRKRRPGGRSR